MYYEEEDRGVFAHVTAEARSCVRSRKPFFSGSAVRGNVNGGRVEWSVGIRFIVNSLPRQLRRALESFNIRLTLSNASKL